MKLVQSLAGVMVCLSLLVMGCTSVEEKSVSASPLSEPAIKSESGATEVIQLPSEGAVKAFLIVARQWGFEPGTITVSKGDRVHLTITSKDVTHGFTIKEYAIAEKIIPGKTSNVEFVADKVGTFSFFCSVPCGKGHTGMNGQLIVRE